MRSGEPMIDHAQTPRDPVTRIAPRVALLLFTWGCASVLIDNRTVTSGNTSQTNAN
jgi:hypothetical protein